MAHTPTQIKHTLRLPLGVLVDDVWQEVGLVEIPVTLHVDVRGGRTLASTNLSQATVLDAGTLADPTARVCSACGQDVHPGQDLLMAFDGDVVHHHCQATTTLNGMVTP